MTKHKEGCWKELSTEELTYQSIIKETFGTHAAVLAARIVRLAKRVERLEQDNLSLSATNDDLLDLYRKFRADLIHTLKLPKDDTTNSTIIRIVTDTMVSLQATFRTDIRSILGLPEQATDPEILRVVRNRINILDGTKRKQAELKKILGLPSNATDEEILRAAKDDKEMATMWLRQKKDQRGLAEAIFLEKPVPDPEPPNQLPTAHGCSAVKKKEHS